MTAETAELAGRHERVREAMRREGLDAVIAYSNVKVKGCVRYLSTYFVRFAGAQTRPDGSYGMFGSCAVLFPLDGEPMLLTDQPWDEARAQGMSAFADTSYAENFGEVFGRRIAEEGYRRVGIDNWFVYPALHYLPLVELAPACELVPTQLIEQVYRVKTPYEIERIRLAEVAAVAGVRAGFAAVGVGVEEHAFALAAETAMRRHGDLELSGSSIISGGPNTATGSSLPGRSDSHVMRSGEWALFDICPSYDGYAGDISRMVVAGSMRDLDPGLRAMYEATLRMNEEVIAAIRPGITPRKLNELAQGVADRAGFGPNKIGLLGHSLGLDIHDPPDYYHDDDPLEEQMCIAVEPCLLIAGVAGTRVEDVVLITADGCEVLSADCPKQLTATG